MIRPWRHIQALTERLGVILRVGSLIAAVAMVLFSIRGSLIRLVVRDVYESLSTTALLITENTYDASVVLARASDESKLLYDTPTVRHSMYIGGACARKRLEHY